MKKFLSISIGLALVSAGIVMYSDASRYEYHRFLIRKQIEDLSSRRFTGSRKTSTSSSNQKTQYGGSSYARQNFVFAKPSIRSRHYTFGNGYSKPNNDGNENLLLRPRSLSLGKYVQPVTTSGKNPIIRVVNGPIKKINPANFSNFVTAQFSMEIPTKTTYEKGTTMEDVFTDGSDNTITVTEYKNTGCNTESFLRCVSSFVQGKNAKLKEVIGYKEIQYVDRKTNAQATFGSSEKTQKNYTSSFLFKKQERNSVDFVTRRFIQGEEKEQIFLIEIQGKQSNANYLVPMSKKVFDSFRTIKKASVL